MNDLRAAAQQALEALEYYEHQKFEWGYADEAAIAALRAALAQQQEQEQEPVAYLWQHSETGRTRVVMPDQVVTADATWVVVGPLYLHPPRREAQQEQEPVAWSDARLRGIASDYFPDAKDWPAAMLCLRHLLMEQAQMINGLTEEETLATASVSGFPQKSEQEQEANYPEEKLQGVAEYISNKYHVWYGVAARDIEEVLRQSARCGLVSNPPRREWRGLSEEERADILFPLTAAGDSDMECARAIEAALKERNT
jgi:hypothetical protein